MNWINTVVLLLAAWLIVFCQSAFQGVRQITGAQFDLLPALMVYTSLSTGLASVTMLAVMGGLLFDALSANPLGVSVLPLFLAGLMLHQKRELICKDEILVHWVLGFGASLIVPIGSLLLLLTLGENPLLGWVSLWQCLVMGIGGAVFTPLFFLVFNRLNRALNYPLHTQTSFRSDRQIKRGRQ